MWNYYKGQLLTTIRSQIFQNVSTVLGGNVLSRVVGFFSTWLLVRHLAPEDYGIFSVLDMVAGLSVGFLTTGFNWSMIKTVASYKDDPVKSWAIAFIVLKVEIVYGLFVAVVIYFSADFIAQVIFHKPELTFYLRLCSVGILGSVLYNYRTSIYQAMMQFTRDAAFAIFNAVGYLLIILLLLLTGFFSIRTISIFYVGLPILISGVAIILLKRHFVKDPNTSSSKILNSMIKEYTWLLCYTLCLWFTGQFHMMILTRYVPMQEVGLYGFAYKFYGFSLILMYAINTVLLPTFSGIKDRESLRYAFQKVIKTVPKVALCYLFTIPFLGLFIELIAGPRYAGATAMLQILIFGAALSTTLSPTVNVLFALNKFKLIAIGGFFLVLANIIGNLTLTRNMGGNGAALAQVGSHLILGLWVTYHAFRLLYSKN